MAERSEEQAWVRAGEPELLGTSVAFGAVRERVYEYGPTEAPVLLTGETGTGKELVARALHAASPRARRPFVAINCAALAPGLFESELFGSARGAFTGADRTREGLVGAARGGTLFLDEVGELAAPLQAKLLRLLEAGSYRPVGAACEQPADLRVLAATNRELGAEVAGGRFRADVYYRLAVLRIHLPPLRERREDLVPLVARFLAEAARARTGGGSGGVPAVTRDALAELAAWHWPGNVRELRHAVERTYVRTRGRPGPIRSFELDPLDPAGSPGPPGPADRPDPAVLADAPGPAAAGAALREPRARPAASRAEWHARERAELLGLLEAERWNVAAAARSLGTSRGALRSRLRRLGIGR